MKTTFMAKTGEIERKWFLIDAEGKPLGRVAAEIAKILRGKNKAIFTPHVDTGDHVIVINAEKIHLTGKKIQQKTYFRHSGYVGGDKLVPIKRVLEKFPIRVLEHAVKGMLPKNTLGKDMYMKMKVYAGPNHPHEAQMPEVLDLHVKCEKIRRDI